MNMKKYNNESGMALVFAIGLLALLLLIGLAFVGNAVNFRKVAENNSARTQSRMLALSAVSRAAASIMIYSHQYSYDVTHNPTKKFPENFDHIHSYGEYDGEVFTDGLLKKDDSDSKMLLPLDGSVVSLNYANRYNVPFVSGEGKAGRWEGNWVYFYDGQTGSSSRIVGRAAWQVVTSSAQILAPVFMRGHVKQIDPADDNFTARMNRWGREIDEVYIDGNSGFPELEAVLTAENGGDEQIEEYEKIYTSVIPAGSSTENEKKLMLWVDRWFIPDFEKKASVAEPRPTTRENYSDSRHSLMRFNISELWQGSYYDYEISGLPTKWQSAYQVGDKADPWYARFGIDTTGSSADKANSENAIQRLTRESLASGDTFDFESVRTAGSDEAYNGLPFLRYIGNVPGTFSDLIKLRKQIAANFNDYCDADSVPASDVPAKDWMADIDSGVYKHPQYTGNEKTPYLYEFGFLFNMIHANAAAGSEVNGIKCSFAASGNEKTPQFNTVFRTAPILKLVNMYAFNTSDDFCRNLRGEVDFGEMEMEFAIDQITLKDVEFEYEVPGPDDTVITKNFTTDIVVDLKVYDDKSGGSQLRSLRAASTPEFIAKAAAGKIKDPGDAFVVFDNGSVVNDSGQNPYPVAFSKNKWYKTADTDVIFSRKDNTAISNIKVDRDILDGRSGLKIADGKPAKPADMDLGSDKTVVKNFALSIDKIEIKRVSAKPRRVVLNAENVTTPASGTVPETTARFGIDYVRLRDDADSAFVWDDFVKNDTAKTPAEIDFTAADKAGLFLGGICNRDPRQNLNPGDWFEARDQSGGDAYIRGKVITNILDPDVAEIAEVMAANVNGVSLSGKVNDNDKDADNAVSPHNQSDGTNKDWETVTEPAYISATGHVSTAVIRNAPMMSPWEIGFIHRGVRWQTVNIKETGGTGGSGYSHQTYWKNSMLATAWSDAEWGKPGTSYSSGDGAILEVIKMCDRGITYGKIDVNMLRPESQGQSDNDKDIVKALFRNIRYGESPLVFLKNSTRDTATGVFPASEASGTPFDLSQASTIADNVVVSRSAMINRSAFLNWETSSGGCLENAFGVLSNQLTDASQEEIIGKTINLLAANNRTPNIVHILVVAQSIRDREGTQVKLSEYDVAASDLEARGGGSVSIDSDGIATKECNLGKFDMFEHKTNDDKNIYFDEITGEVKMFVELIRDTDTGKLTIRKIDYL